VKSKVSVPPEVSRSIRGFGLPREVLVALLVRIHDAVLRDYETSKHRRMDDRHYWHRIAISDNAGNEHLFVLTIDDATADDQLRIEAIGHGMR
jgi:hypothetical protein